MGLTFGELYSRLTSSALEEIRDRVLPPASIVDFGAGCGRLALPLAEEGYGVTAVEPSARMLDELRARGPELDIATVQVPMQEYEPERPHDLALCVFTVVAYLLEPPTLGAAFAAAGAALVPDGLFLLDVPHESMFEGFDYETGEIIRHVEIEAVDGSVFEYREDTLLRTPAGEVRYEDAFRIRNWRREEVVEALHAAGFATAGDVSARFTGLGADYLLMRRTC